MNVYVMTCDDPDHGAITKVGVARDAAARRYNLQRTKGRPVSIVAQFDCGDGQRARHVERAAHALLAQRCVALGSEWFTASTSDAVTAVQEAMLPRPVKEPGENLVSQYLHEIESFISETGMNESRFGLLTCANPRALDRVRDGSARLRTLQQMLDFVRREREKRKGEK